MDRGRMGGAVWGDGKFAFTFNANNYSGAFPKGSNLTSIVMSKLEDRPLSFGPAPPNVPSSVYLPGPVIGHVQLSGDPLLFPFDRYHVNMTMLFPGTLEEQRVVSGSIVNASWKATSNSVVKENEEAKMSEHTILVEFQRNYTNLVLIIPLLAIFYLLGASFIFDNTLDRLGNRLALTLGIIALIFTLNNIIDQTRPITGGPTVADSILSIAIIAAIVFPISSILSSSPIIQKRFSGLYGFIDAIMFVFMSGIAIVLLSNFNLEVTRWLLPVIIFGLGYGLLVRKMSFSKIKSIMLAKGNPDRHDYY